MNVLLHEDTPLARRYNFMSKHIDETQYEILSHTYIRSHNVFIVLKSCGKGAIPPPLYTLVRFWNTPPLRAYVHFKSSTPPPPYQFSFQVS